MERDRMADRIAGLRRDIEVALLAWFGPGEQCGAGHSITIQVCVSNAAPETLAALISAGEPWQILRTDSGGRFLAVGPWMPPGGVGVMVSSRTSFHGSRPDMEELHAFLSALREPRESATCEMRGGSIAGRP